MQKSKFNEHKLILQTFLASERGSRLLSAAAEASSNTPSSMAEWIADLPADMDFYVPVRDQRRTWRGDGEVAVAAILDADANEALAFYPDGSWRRITRPDHAQVGALFVIHPSEPKNVVRDSETVGPTIERDASSLSSRPMFNETCDETSVDPCDDPGNGGYASTYVGTISIDFADGAFSGDPEIYFVTCPDVGSCETSDEKVVPAFGTRTINLLIYPEQASSSQSMTADLWEADSGLNGGDDDKGVSIPDITGEGSYISYDPFYDKVWADYNVFIQ